MKSTKYVLILLSLLISNTASATEGASKMKSTHPSAKQPNIIWVVLEDISLDLAYNGTPAVKTPNLDRIASEGVRYSNAFATAAVCSTARSAIFTGMHATSIGAQHHRSHLSDNYTLPKGVRMVSEYMRDAGYVSLLMGPKQKTDFNFTPKVNAFDAQDGEVKYSGGAYTHAPIDTKILDKSAWKTYQEKYADKPFFTQINYSETHRTFIADPDDPINPKDVKLPSYYPDHEITRRDWALYLETVQTVDKKVGLLFDELEEAGVLDNSIVFIFGDHGRAMLRDKQWLYDGGLRVPLIVWGKGIPANQSNDTLVSLIDIMPTSMDLAGIKVPQYIEGKVMFGPHKETRDYVYAHKDRCDETDDRVRAVRDNQFKYIKNFYPEKPYTDFNAYKNLQYPVMALMNKLNAQGKLTPQQALFMADSRPPEELYDTVNDPDEVNNLATDPAYKTQLIRLRNQLSLWQAQTGDMGMVDEDPKEIQYWDDFFARHYKKTMLERGLAPDISPDDYLIWWDKFLTKLGK